DQRGRNPHAAQRDEERVLPSDQIADAPEHERAERPDEEPDREERDRAEQRGNWMASLKELDRKDGCQAAEHVEVVPLDDVTDRRGGDHAAQLARLQSWSGVGFWHERG